MLKSADIELDEESRSVRKRGRRIEPTARAFDLLRCLMQRAPAAVERASLVREVWGGADVTDATIASAVALLRTALGAPHAGWVRSVRGHGYSFETAVTRTEDLVPAAGEERSGTQLVDEKTILIVDDEPEIIDALKRTLRDRGYKFLGATSGKEALARIAEAPSIHLVITDVSMPEMTGIDLVQTLRKSHPNVRRIILTGVASLDTAMQAINLGEVHRFLLKPWDQDEVREAVREVLERRRATDLTVPGDSAAALPALRDRIEPELSPRLRQTLDELLTGASEKEIAAHLGISLHTVHQYVKTLYRLVGAGSRAQFMALVQRPPVPASSQQLQPVRTRNSGRP